MRDFDLHGDLLWPRPATLDRGDGAWRPGATVTVTADASVAPAAVARLVAALEDHGRPVHRDASGEVTLRRAGDLPAHGYRLRVDTGGVELVAGDVGGFVMGAATFGRWLRLHAAADAVPAVRVDDRPSFGDRGVLLDVSRNRVPRMAELLAISDQLAGWGVNQLQLYTEHTFAYAGHETVWRDADPYTCDDMRRLDAHCRGLGIELVPNQNCFGHMHRWLVHEPYRRLAEVPEGIDHIFSVEREPFSLAATDPGSLALVDDLLGQLLPCFASRQVNVGLDETLDLCQGRSRAACEERGAGRVYLDYLREVHRRVAARGHTMQFWGDVILGHPELIPELPRDATALEWGYEAEHPFTADVRHFADSGLPFLVCPGTSSWNSIAGRIPNAVANLAAATTAAAAHGARGLLVTDWGDHGHLQPRVASWPGLLVGAGLAWNAAAAADVGELPLAALLDRDVFRDPTGRTGAAAVALGEVYRRAPVPRNGSAPFFLLLFGPEELDRRDCPRPPLADLESFAAATAAATAGLDAARPTGAGGAILVDELRWAADLLAFACRFGAWQLHAAAVPTRSPLHRTDATLASELTTLTRRLRDLWVRRDRPGGLELSVRRLLWHPRRLGLKVA